MNKLKICVYAIAKNEEKHVERWVNSMKEADEIYVLDTGSTDNTAQKLKELNVNVTSKIIKPWRFDVARNESLNLVPKDADICVCTDLDEVFNPGWRDILEKNFKDNDRINYTLNFNFDDKGNPNINYIINKIHTRDNYKWIYPVHEVLKCTKDNEKISTINNLFINHYPDRNKSRKDYLRLLKLNLKENKKDPRSYHYLGREYMYYKDYDNAIKYLKKHLKLKNSNFKEERCASCRFIGRMYKEKNNIKEAIKWYTKAAYEAPYIRDSYVELALIYHEQKDYNKVIYLCNKALDIKNNNSYVNEMISFNHTIYDLLSMCYYYKKEKTLALYYIDKALEISPNIERLKNNKLCFLEMKS